MQPSGRNLNRLVSAPPHLYSALLASNTQLDSAGLAEPLKVEHVPTSAVAAVLAHRDGHCCPWLVTRDTEWSGWRPFAEGGSREQK